MFWGCIGLHYYDLYITPAKVENNVKINKTLQIEDIETNMAFWHQRILYRKNPYQVQYFPLNQWAKMPGELIKDTIIHYYRNSSFFKKVINDNSSITPEIMMRITIDALEMLQKEKQWYAHLALYIEMMDVKTEKTLLTHSFDRIMQIKGKKARYLPEKISEILQQELLTIIKKLRMSG